MFKAEKKVFVDPQEERLYSQPYLSDEKLYPSKI